MNPALYCLFRSSSFQPVRGENPSVRLGLENRRAERHRYKLLVAGCGFALLLFTGISGAWAQTICNGKTVTTNNFSVSIVAARSAATVLGSVTNTANVIDADLTNFGTITSAVGLGSGGSISSQVTSTTFPAGSVAGYALQNTTILGATLLSNITITTYLNGVQQDISSAAATPLVERTDLAVSGQRVLGIVTTKPFNEIRVTFSATLSSTLRVYDPLVLYPTLSLTAVATNASNPAVNDGVVSASIAGGRAPYSYTYTGPSTSVVTSNSAVTGRAPGSYTITVSDANGCTDTDLVTVGFPPQFVCTPNIGYLTSSNLTAPVSTTAQRVNLVTGATTTIKSGILASPATNSYSTVNGIGFNPKDNYLYGAVDFTSAATGTPAFGSGTIARFDANFDYKLYSVTNVVAGTSSADIDLNGIYYLYNGVTQLSAGSTTIQRIDLSTGVPTALPNLTLSPATSLSVTDIAFSPVDSRLYTLSTPANGGLPSLYRIAVPPVNSSATSATVTNLGTVTGVGSATSTTRYFGAAYFDGDGNFYALDNTSGTTYKIAAVHTFTGSATRTAISLSTTGKAVSSNDGARCPTAQVAAEASFAFNCGTATVAGSFTANGPGNQAGTLVIPLTGATAGIASFTVLTAGFAANPALYTTTLTAGQTSVSVPILYNGSGSPGARTLSFDSEQATNAACSLTISIAGQPDLTTSIGQPTAMLIASQPNALPITVNNIGNVATTGLISSTLTLPASVTAPATFTSNGFSCTTVGGAVACTSSATLASGSSTTFAVPFTPGVATIGNTLSFTNTVATANERLTTNNTATFTTATPVIGQPDLITSISQPVPNLVVGQTSSLPISVSNIGTIANVGTITQTLTIPATVTAPAAFTSNGFNCTTTLTTVSCVSSATLATGSSTTFAVPITPTAAAVGVAPVFSTTVATTDDESNENNNTATLTVTTAIVGQPDLTISLAQPAPGFVAGRAGSLPVTVNNGGSAATSGPVTVTLTIPAGVTAPAAFTSNGFSCSTAATRISCSSSAVIATGASTTLAIPLTPLAAAIGTNVFTATVLTGNESTTANNTASLTVTVSASVTAAPDAGTASAGTGGTAVANVVTNDVVNGVPAQLGAGGNATVAVVGTYPAGITLNTTTGSVSVAQGTTPGSYTVGYQLCDLLASPTCATTTVTITVLPSINPSPDNGTVCTGLAINNIVANDLVNGQAVSLGSNATIAAVGTYPAGITLNPATGSVSVTAGIAAAGSYTLVYQLCSTLGTPACATSTATVTVNPSVTATLSSATICNGISTTLIATGGTSYLFSTGTANSTGLLVVSPTTNGSNPYSVTVTSAQGCSAIATGTVTVNPSVTATLSSATICNGLSGTLTAGGAGTGGSYVLNPGNLTSTTGVFVVSPTTNGVNTYTLTATSQFGCVGVATGTVTVNPSVTATLSSATICNGTSTTLMATGGVNYLFSTGVSNTTGLLPVSPTVNGSNPYSVTVTSAQGCSAIASGTVTVNAAVTATLTSATICNGTSTTLTATGGTTYQFSTGATNTTGLLVVTPTANGTNPYSVTVTSAQGCSAVASGTVTVNPSVTATLSSATICNGTSATLTATGGTSYLFSTGVSNNTGLLTVSPTANGANPYSVTVTSAQGCSAVASGTVTVNAAVTATLSSATICNGTSTTLTATGGTSYRFSTGVSNTTGLLPVSPTVNGSNPYSVTVTSAQGCSAIATGTVTVNPSVTATLSSATICNGTSATLTATGGISYLLGPGSLTSTSGVFIVNPTVNGSNPYSVTVTSAQGCSAIATGTVTVNPSVTATLSVATICNGTSTTLTATGGANYLFSTGTANSTGLLVVSPTTNGTNPYSVTVTSAQGCSAIATGTVTVNPSVTATLSSATICNGTSTTLTATGGANYLFSTGTANSTGLLVVNPTTNGTNPYSVTVTSAQGCSAIATGTVTVNPSVTATLSSATICNGTSTTLIATGGTSYLFSTGTANSTGLLVVSPTTNGTNPYSVTVTSAQGCSAIATGTVTVNPSVTATLSSATICNGTSATLTATGGISYLLGPGNLTSTSGVFIVNPTVNGSNPYSVTVTSAQGCSAIATGTVTVNPSVTATLSVATICNGTSTTLTATGGSSYRFSEGTTNTTGLLVVAPTSNGTNPYSVTVTSAQGCSAVATGNVTVNPSVTATLSSATICNGTSATLTATGGVSYRFGPGNTNTTGLLPVSPTVNGTNPYSVTVTSAQGCSAVAFGNVTVNALPQPTIAGSTTVCAGQPISLTASPTTGLAYAWGGPGGNLGSSNPLTIVNSTSANSGTYQVRVTDVNGCTATASQNVTVKPVPQVQILNTSIVCTNNSPAVAIATQVTGGTPPVSYAWYRSGAAGVISTAPNPVFSVADTYSLIVTDASGCMSNTATVAVMTPSPLAVNVQMANARCFGAQGTITVTTSGGTAPYTVSYYNGSGLMSSTMTSGVSTLQTTAGSYTIVVMDTNGCSLTQTAAITQPPLLTATLTGSGSVCAGQNTGSITSSVTGGTAPYSYSWSNGATTPNLTGLSGGTYSVVVTDANGCITSQTVTLPTNPLPATPTVSVTQPTCVTLTGTIRVLTPATGVQYSFNNGIGYQPAPTMAGLSPDVYQVRVRDNATGCVSLPASVTINPVPNPPVVSITGNTTYCAGQPISLTASPASGVTYAWSGPSGNLSSTNPLVITNTTPGQTGRYQVTVTDANGCTAVAATSVVVYALPVATLTANSTTMCYGQPISLTAGGGVSYAFSPNVTGISGSTASFTAAQGTAQYSVTVTSAQGCLSAPAVVTVTVSSCVSPLPDSGTASAGTGGVAVVNVTANDLINTLAATLGTNGNATIAAVGNYPTGITLNPATGSVSVAVGTVPGSYTVAYQLCDRLTPVTCATTTVAVLVTPSVIANTDSGTASSGTGGVAVANVAANDLINGATAVLGTSATIAAIGTYQPGITLNPATGSVSVAVGTVPGSYTVAYQLCSIIGTPACATTTVSVLVTPTVVANTDSGTASSGTGGVAVANVAANDLINGATAVLGTSATIAAIGTYQPGITLNPATGSVSVAVGTVPGSYTVAYQLCSIIGTPACATTTVAVLVTPSVIANTDSGTASSGTGGVAVANVAANDLVNGLAATLGTGGNATIAPIGAYPNGITLDPATGSVSVAVGTTPGSYTLAYQLCDRISPVTCATTTLTVLVTPAPPVVTDDINTVNLNTPARGNVLTNDYDPQGLPLLATLTTPPATGTLVFAPTGAYTYTPPTDFTGTASFTYQACNSAGLCRPATVSISVLANPTVGNNPPLARNDATRTRQGQALRIVVLANDSDPDAPAPAKGQLSGPVLLGQPASGTAVVNPDGSITYSPPAGFTGLVSFSYQICDGASPALCSVAQVLVNVLPPVLGGTLLAPVGVDDGFLTRQNQALVGDVSANDMDLNSPVQTLRYSTGQPQSGSVVMSGVGSYTYTPAVGYSGPVSFTYSVCNSSGLCSVATVYGLVQVTDKVALLAKVYLQGALLGVYSPSVLMRDDLRAKGLLPAESPYGSLGALTPVGSLSASVTAVTGSDAIVDWVYVELRSPVSSSVVIDSRSALLQRDGDIVDVDGVSGVRFDVAVSGSYYVAVRHRNHLGAMSGLSLPLSVSGLVLDFRSGSTPVYSYTASSLNQALVVVDQGVALWAGNALSDMAPTPPHEVIQFQGTNNDPNVIYQRVIGATGNFFVTPFYKLKGYYDTDIDMNGETLFQGSGNDVESIYQNIIKNHPGNQFTVPFFKIREQLP